MIPFLMLDMADGAIARFISVLVLRGAIIGGIDGTGGIDGIHGAMVITTTGDIIHGAITHGEIADGADMAIMAVLLHTLKTIITDTILIGMVEVIATRVINGDLATWVLTKEPQVMVEDLSMMTLRLESLLIIGKILLQEGLAQQILVQAMIEPN